MSSSSYSLLFLVPTLLLFQVSAKLATIHHQNSDPKQVFSGSPLVGGWEPILDLKDKNVVEIARFAVKEHNKKANSKLRFGGVVKGEQQVVAGMNYRLYLKVKNGGVLENYVAVVYTRPWEKLRTLTSFHKLG